MLGLVFFLLGRLFSYLGVINDWPPLFSAAFPVARVRRLCSWNAVVAGAALTTVDERIAPLLRAIPARIALKATANENPRLGGDFFAAAPAARATIRVDARLCRRENADEGPLFGPLDGEGNLPIDEREQRVVLAHADVGPGMHLRAALPNDNGARGDRFTAVGLDTEPFGMRIAAIARAAACFLCAMNSYLALP